jgi:hypothetical protein
MSENQTPKHLGTAWSCKDCGHIMSQHGDKAPTGKCPECKANPAHWLAAELTDVPADADVPSVADYVRDEISGNDPAGLFATTPPGTQEDLDPELKVRY